MYFGIAGCEPERLQQLCAAFGNAHFHPDREPHTHAYGFSDRERFTDADALRERLRFVQSDAEPEYRRISVRVPLRELISRDHGLELGSGEYTVCDSVRKSHRCADHYACDDAATASASVVTPADRRQRGRHAEL